MGGSLSYAALNAFRGDLSSPVHAFNRVNSVLLNPVVPSSVLPDDDSTMVAQPLRSTWACLLVFT